METKEEIKFEDKPRYSLVKKGTKIKREWLIVKRPGYGIKPKYLEIVIGRTTKRDIKTDEWIAWEDI